MYLHFCTEKMSKILRDFLLTLIINNIKIKEEVCEEFAIPRPFDRSKPNFV